MSRPSWRENRSEVPLPSDNDESETDQADQEDSFEDPRLLPSDNSSRNPFNLLSQTTDQVPQLEEQIANISLNMTTPATAAEPQAFRMEDVANILTSTVLSSAQLKEISDNQSKAIQELGALNTHAQHELHELKEITKSYKDAASEKVPDLSKHTFTKLEINLDQVNTPDERSQTFYRIKAWEASIKRDIETLTNWDRVPLRKKCAKIINSMNEKAQSKLQNVDLDSFTSVEDCFNKIRIEVANLDNSTVLSDLYKNCKIVNGNVKEFLNQIELIYNLLYPNVAHRSNHDLTGRMLNEVDKESQECANAMKQLRARYPPPEKLPTDNVKSIKELITYYINEEKKGSRGFDVPHSSAHPQSSSPTGTATVPTGSSDGPVPMEIGSATIAAIASATTAALNTPRGRPFIRSSQRSRPRYRSQYNYNNSNRGRSSYRGRGNYSNPAQRGSYSNYSRGSYRGNASRGQYQQRSRGNSFGRGRGRGHSGYHHQQQQHHQQGQGKRCFRCDSPSHIARFCKKPQSSSNALQTDALQTEEEYCEEDCYGYEDEDAEGYYEYEPEFDCGTLEAYEEDEEPSIGGLFDDSFLLVRTD